jgi:hypothetical protein
MPVLGIGGSASFGPIIGDHLRHVANNVQAINVESSGHRVAEEQPADVTDALINSFAACTLKRKSPPKYSNNRPEGPRGLNPGFMFQPRLCVDFKAGLKGLGAGVLEKSAVKLRDF